MKRKALLLTGVLAMVLVVPMAHAAKGDMAVSITGGMGIPVSKFSDVPTAAEFAKQSGLNVGDRFV